MGKRIIVPEFRYDGKPWVVIPRQDEDWYPSLIDHATIMTAIGFCEEWKYPQKDGRKGWRYAYNFYRDCMEIIDQYTLTLEGYIIAPKEWDMELIHKQCEEIYRTKYDLNGKFKVRRQ